MIERRHLSVSQHNQYARCPYAYKLARIDKVWQRPAAWLAQGSAVHEAAEWWERTGRSGAFQDMAEVYSESYEKHINEACEVTPNFDWWFASGPYGGEADTERRYFIGMEQCEKYVEWYQSHPTEVIWIAPDGEPGIELSFDIDLDGVLIRGFIDAVIQIFDKDDCGDYLIVRDNKTGNHPGDDFQLGVYGVALAEQFEVFASRGDYWMGKSGKPTYPFDLTQWSREKVSEVFHELEDNINAGRFDPLPEPSKCRFCDVSYACKFSAA